MRVRVLLALFAALSLLAGACGDDDTAVDDPAAAVDDPATSENGDDGSPSTDTDDDGMWTEERRAADQQTLDAAILTLDDMPTGWEQLPNDDDEGVDQEEVAECVGANVEDLYDDDDPEADASFGAPDESQLDVGWTTAATVDLAEFRFETLTSDTAFTCLRDLLVEGIANNEEDVEIGDVTLNRMSFPQLGDGSTAMRVTIPVSAEGMSVEAFVDAVFLRVGRAIGTVSYLSIFTPPDTAQVEGFAQAMLDKLDPNAVE